MTAYDIIRKPVVTEASMAATADRKYTFVVDKRANKVEIAKAVEKIFGVEVERVTTMRAESFGVSVAANARHSIGSPQNGARSLLEPKRWLRPDAMMTQPTGRSSFI